MAAELELGASEPGYAYTGREWDRETGLYYYRARYYDPKAGRFISEDPIGLAGGMNTYAYVSGNPVDRVDPSGLASYVIMVGDPGLGRHNVGNSFNLAAETRAQQLRANGDTATIVRVSTVQDMAAALSNNGNIDGGVYYFGHAGVVRINGQLYSALAPGENPGFDTNVSALNANQLSGANMGPNAAVWLNACHAGSSYAGDPIAQTVSDQLKRGVYAYDVGMFFSSNTNAKNSASSTGASSVPVYMLPENRAQVIPFVSR